MTTTPLAVTGLGAHLDALHVALDAVRPDIARLDVWGAHLARVLVGGGRLLAAGNGGSAAHAQHLTSELVGRFVDDRRPFSALALHAETSSVTAIANDYGVDAIFARQVEAHGRPGDVLMVLSTSGRSPNVLAAVEAAHRCCITPWALTGPAPNPLAACAQDSICVAAPSTATVQEVHQVLVHLLCIAVEQHLSSAEGLVTATPGPMPAQVTALRGAP
jgi:D-sedoheptulose 7-phosphate isomerase